MTTFVLSSSPPSELSENKDASLSNKSLSGNNCKNEFIKSFMTPVPQTKISHGRKTFAFWTLVILLYLLAMGNILLTMIILGVLKLGTGMQSIEIIPEENAVKFFGDVDLDKIYKLNGIIQGFQGENLEISSIGGSLFINVYNKQNRLSNKLKIDENGTTFNGLGTFLVKNKQNETIFDATAPKFNNLRDVKVFKSKSITTNKIRSRIDDDLSIVGDTVYLKGNEGARIEAKEIFWSADQDIHLQSNNSTLILSGKQGVYIDVNRIPMARLSKKSFKTAQFKLCVCMPEGKLFRVPVASTYEPVYCHQADMSSEYNPCL